MSDKVYILLKDYTNDGTYEDYICDKDEFAGVFSTEEKAIIEARKLAIAELSHALDSLTDDDACFGDYKEYRDVLGGYIIEFSKRGRGDFAFVSGKYTYKILSTCMNSEPKSYEPQEILHRFTKATGENKKVNIDIQPSYESIKAAETAFNTMLYMYSNLDTCPDVAEIEKDFSEEFIREQNNLYNGKEV